MTSRTTPTRHYRWVILTVATVAQATACMFAQSLGAIGAFIKDDLDLNATQVGLLVSASQVVPIVGLLVAGELLDRFSERLIVGVGSAVVGLSLLSGALAASYPAVLLCLIVVGAGYSTAQPGGSVAVANWFPASQRGFAMGIRQAGLPLGGAAGAALLPLLAGQSGWQAAFLAGGLTALFGALVFVIFYRVPDLPRPRADSPTGTIGSHVRSRLRLLRSRSMINIYLAGLTLVTVQYGFQVFSVLHVVESTGTSVEQAAVLLFIALLAGVVGRISLAYWSDHCRFGRYVPVLVCMGAVVLGTLWLAMVPMRSVVVIGVVMAWMGFFGFGWYGPWVAYVAESAAPGRSGFALGAAMAVNQIAVVATPPLLGVLRDTTLSYTLVWVVLGLLTGAALLVCTFREVTHARRSHRPRYRRSEPEM